MFHYVLLNDPHPTLGGKTSYGPLSTREAAQSYGEREVAASAEIGIQGVTFRIVSTRHPEPLIVDYA